MGSECGHPPSQRGFFFCRNHSNTLTVLRTLSKCRAGGPPASPGSLLLARSRALSGHTAGAAAPCRALGPLPFVSPFLAPHFPPTRLLCFPLGFAAAFSLESLCLLVAHVCSRPGAALREVVSQLSVFAVLEDAVQRAIRTTFGSSSPSGEVSAADFRLTSPPLHSSARLDPARSRSLAGAPPQAGAAAC